MIKIKNLVTENSNNLISKKKGLPRGKMPYMVTDGKSDSPKSWEAKLKYFRITINKIIGYEVLE